MITRRALLGAGAAGTAAFLASGCRGPANAPIPQRPFEVARGARRFPWLDFATSLPREHSYRAEVEGRIPDDLRGTLYRNGPGLFRRGGARKRCLLDGDGMLQAFTFDDRGVLYRNRFTRTEKFVEEQSAGEYLYATWTTQAPGGRLANLLGMAMASQAGVSVWHWRDALYAFDESSAPYELDPDTLETRGPTGLGSLTGCTSFAAHPKLDHRTGDWLHFGLEYGRDVTVHLNRFSADGRLASHRVFPLPRYSYLHDYFVTERWVVFNVHPAEFSIHRYLLGSASLVGSMDWRPEHGNLVLAIPREGDAEPIVLETEARWMWHAVNGYDRRDETVIEFVAQDTPSSLMADDSILFTVMEGRNGLSPSGSVQRCVLDLPRRTIRAETLAEGAYEFPVVHPTHACHRHQYAYLARNSGSDPFWNEVVRLDTESGRARSYRFGAHRYCSEPIFAPMPAAGAGREEPGWILTLVQDGDTHRGFLAVLRADHLEDGPLALVHLRHHSPLTFHGTWHAAA